jgi:hypothetical protein
MRRARWTLESVVAELQKLHAAGESMTYAVLVAAGHGSVVSAAEHHAGSFSRAMKLAGLDYQPTRRPWTRHRVLDEIRTLHREGTAMSSERIQQSGKTRLLQASREYFGSWRGALAAAGVPRFKRGRWPSWSAIRDKLIELHAAGVRMTTTALAERGHADLVAAARSEATTWNKALARAGIPVIQTHEHWSRERVLDEIRALHRDGVALGSRVVAARGHAKLVKAATSHFGGWPAACEAAVPSYVPALRRWTVDAVIDAIRIRHRAGKSVRSTDVAREDGSLVQAAQRLEIAWRDACRRAGVPARALKRLPERKRIRWNEARIVAHLREANIRGTLLLVNRFRSGFVQAVQRRYGSWSAAMIAAGLARQHRRDVAAARAARARGMTTARGRRR